MDFIEALSIQLRLPDSAARALAGQLLELVETTAREQVSFGLASRVRAAVPELLAWQAALPTLAPGAAYLGAPPLPLPAAPGGEAELELLLERLRVPAQDRALVRSLLNQFLAARLDPPTLATLRQAMPALAA